jgi:mevalonate kinase
MPELNGTGPEGKGPMTGSGRGNCVVLFETTAAEMKFLKTREQSLQAQLKQIKTRIKNIKNQKAQKELAQ